MTTLPASVTERVATDPDDLFALITGIGRLPERPSGLGPDWLSVPRNARPAKPSTTSG